MQDLNRIENQNLQIQKKIKILRSNHINSTYQMIVKFKKNLRWRNY